MNIIGVINKLRKSSIILFCLSFTAIIGCLIINNILVSFKYSNSLYPFNFKVGTIIYCNASNNYCTNILDKKVPFESQKSCHFFSIFDGLYFVTQNLKNYFNLFCILSSLAFVRIKSSILLESFISSDISFSLFLI